MNFSDADSVFLKLGWKQIVQDSPSTVINSCLHKIPPLPIYRRNLQSSHQTRKSLRPKGYKFLAKLPAAGPETLKVLQSIQGSQCIKWVQYFEFDHYLCDSSHINDLRRVCNKIKGIKRLNLVIRRVDNPVELEKLSPFIARFTRLTSIRVEFPKTENVTENAWNKLCLAIGKCYFLRSIEHVENNQPQRSERSSNIMLKPASALKWLENVKFYIKPKKETPSSDLDLHLDLDPEEQQQIQKSPQQPRISSKIKSFDFTISWHRQWAKKGGEEVITPLAPEIGIPAFEFASLLQRVRVKIINMDCQYEGFANLFTNLSFLPNLRYIEIEHINCQLTDIAIIAYAQGLTKLNQLEYFSLKILQNPNISEGCIEKFAEMISRLDNLSNFDLYFRKLDLPPRGILELGRRIQYSPNVQCSCGKESIHISKKK